MGGVSVEGGGGGGRKNVDSNVNMVPMIDLLISVIAFLLMTAVWVQTGALQAQQPRSAPSNQEMQPQEVQEQLKIFIRADGIALAVTQADTQGSPIARGPQMLDTLRGRLRERRQASANQARGEVWISPEQSVHYNDIIEVMDIVYEVWGEGVRREAGEHISDRITIRFL